MKITTKGVLAFFPLSAALIWTAAAQSDSQSHATTPSDDTITAEQAEAVVRMDQRREEIQSRLGMSAALEQPEPGDEDFVAEYLEKGLIVEATLEEVEAALEAAKATPGLDDDHAAMTLAQWGSYRFFLDEKGFGDN